MKKSAWPVVLAITLVLSFMAIGCPTPEEAEKEKEKGSEGSAVWQPTITASTPMNGSGEYIGDTGIQRSSGASELTLAPIANGFTITIASGTYKQIAIQFPNAGGTNYYTADGATGVTNGKAYTISFNASATAAGAIRFAANGGSSFADDQPINTSSSSVSFSWTQSGGNLKFDTGSTATGSVITITGIKITSP